MLNNSTIPQGRLRHFDTHRSDKHVSNVHGFELREHQELWCARRGGPVSGGPGELYTVWLCAQVGQVSKAQNSHGNFYNKNGPRDYHFKHFLDLENKLKPFFWKKYK